MGSAIKYYMKKTIIAILFLLPLFCFSQSKITVKSGTDTSGRFVNLIQRVAGKDSIIFWIGGTRYAIKDSAGGAASFGSLTGVPGDNAVLMDSLERYYISVTAIDSSGFIIGFALIRSNGTKDTIAFTQPENSVPISSLTDAEASNTIANGTHAQTWGWADGNIILGGTSKGLLELSSTTKGLLVPRMTAAQRLAITTPGNGNLVYDTDSLRYMLFNTGTNTWKGIAYTGEAGSGGGTPAGNFGNVQLNRNSAFATPGSDSLNFNAGLSILGSLTVSGLTSGRMAYTTTAGLLTTSANITYDGTSFTTLSNFGVAQVNPNAGAKLHVLGIANYTNASAISGFYDYQRYGSWDAVGSVSAAGTTLAIGGYRSSQWTGLNLYVSGGTAKLAMTNTLATWAIATTNITAGRFSTAQGADVASAVGAIAVGGDGNTFELTGTSAVTLISNLTWQNGSEITLLFTSTASLTDGTANSGTDIGMELAGNTNFTGSAGASITLKLSEIGGTQRWREKCRSVN